MKLDIQNQSFWWSWLDVVYPRVYNNLRATRYKVDIQIRVSQVDARYSVGDTELPTLLDKKFHDGTTWARVYYRGNTWANQAETWSLIVAQAQQNCTKRYYQAHIQLLTPVLLSRLYTGSFVGTKTDDDSGSI